MKYNKLRIYIFFIICIFLLFICCILNIYKNEFKEALTQNDTIVLIGDSILNNSSYVSVGNTVMDNLKMLHGNNIILNAKDNATIETCYNQLNNIIDCESYHLYVSIGGNNLLNEFNSNENININIVFEKYKELIKYIKIKFSKTNIYIFNLYFPPNNKYLKIVKEWNKLINLLEYKILRLDNLLIDDVDFVYEIEPSMIGSKKISKLIYET